ncbi:MAG: hypothetical protein KGL39_33330 [Patescibacteria group bacterium]|nr:hypothetical protein [Patescibacteria group bacterium]
MNRSLSILLPLALTTFLVLKVDLKAAEAPTPPRKVPVKLFTAASAIVPARRDAKSRGLLAQTDRYISLYNELEEDLPARFREVSSLVNHLSRLPAACIPPVRVAGTNGRVLRINLHERGIDPSAWDRLVANGSGRVPTPEAYHYRTFTTIEEETEEWGYPDGRGGYSKKFLKKTGKKTRVIKTTLGEFLPTKETLELATLTLTQFPLVRGDWFLYYAALEPAYSDLLGLKTSEEIDQYLGIGRKVLDDVGAITQGVVLTSEVAEHIRGLERKPSPIRKGKGYRWDSHDYQTSIDQDDLLANPDNLLDAKPAAYETIFSLRNGLQGYGVFDKDLKRLNRAAINIARDKRNRFSSPEIEIRNCMACHALGINTIEDEVRLTARGDLAAAIDVIREKDERKAQQLVDRFFASDIRDEVAADQALFARAVKSCNGLDPAANALAVQNIMVRYETPLTLEELAFETGFPVVAIRAALANSKNVKTPGLTVNRYLFALVGQTATTGGADHSPLASLVGRKIRRDQYERSGHQDLMRLLLALPPGPQPAPARPKEKPKADQPPRVKEPTP